MPELPEVETVMRGLAPALEGKRIVRVEQKRADLRKPFPPRLPERLAGRTISTLSRRGKYILAGLSGDKVLIVHLGMTGRFQVERNGQSRGAAEFYYEHPRDPKHDHLILHMAGETIVIFNDARRFGFVDLASRAQLDQHKALAGLGVEPLGNRFSAALLLEAAGGKAAPLKALLMDQSVVAGLGNIYASEALFRSALHPERPSSSLSDDEASRLAQAIRSVLEEAIAAGGSTLRDFAHADGSSGSFQERFFVYDREEQPCLVCSTPVRRIVQSGRSTFFCSACQPHRPAPVKRKRP